MDNSLMKKLQLKGRTLTLFNLPEALEEAFPKEAVRASEIGPEPQAVLGFAQTQEEMKHLIHAVMPCLPTDTVVWLAYPKKSSKRYQSDITRDRGWSPLHQYGYEPVSQIALDEDWSALRFKPFEQIVNPLRKSKMIKPEESI